MGTRVRIVATFEMNHVLLFETELTVGGKIMLSPAHVDSLVEKSYESGARVRPELDNRAAWHYFSPNRSYLTLVFPELMQTRVYPVHHDGYVIMDDDLRRFINTKALQITQFFKDGEWVSAA